MPKMSLDWFMFLSVAVVRMMKQRRNVNTNSATITPLHVKDPVYILYKIHI
jgi:hypothetical protein